MLNEIEKLAYNYERRRIKKDELENKINEYIQHVEEHFSDEEILMQEYYFPFYEMHKLVHEKEIIIINEFHDAVLEKDIDKTNELFKVV